jgi:hypothetical protein
MRRVYGYLALAVTTPAYAGRTYYGWLEGTDVQPERGVELMSSLYEELESDGAETTWWMGPMIGVTDRLELGFPLQLTARDSEGAHFDRFGADARYRLASQDPVDAPAVVPLVRVAIDHVIGTRSGFGVRSDFVLSYAVDRLHVLVDAGVAVESLSREWQLRPGAGTSIRVVGELRLGAEVYAEIPVGRERDPLRSTIEAESEESWVVAGPNLAWSHGRIWLSASYGIGLVGIVAAPKAQWGVAF